MKQLYKTPFSAIGLSLALAACSMAPNFQPVDVTTPPIPQTMPEHGVQAASLGWQDYFQDARLRALIDTALRENRDLRTAVLNTEATRLQYGITRAQRLPDIGASGSKTRARTSADTSITRQSSIVEQYEVGLGITAFELDLFGRIKSMSDAALHNYFAAQYARDAAHISLIAGVANAYFAEKVAAENMKLSQEVMHNRSEQYRLAKISRDAGVISDIDLYRIETQIETAKADYAAAGQQKQAAHNALLVLCGGKLPENLPEGLPLNRQFNPQLIAAGLPSDLLNNRPDIRQAEEQLKAANAQIGAARAAFFPRIALTSAVGSASGELNGLFESSSATWQFIPQITLPIFTWGKNKNQLNLAEVRKDIGVAQYEKTVQAAFQDAANALNAKDALNKQIQARARVEKATDEVLRLVSLRYEHGVASALDLLDAQRQNYGAQQLRLQTERAVLGNYIDLYKVFGGGLHKESKKETPSAQANAQSPKDTAKK